LLPVRKTLVAPGFLEPCVWGSGKPIARLTTTANEIDPSKYATGINQKYVINSSMNQY
jgi:hypothetical protein